MASERYVLLGLAQARSGWFRAVGQWANAASIPAEFVKCVSAEEVRARLASTRPHSALLVDGSLPALDRDLVDEAGQRGVAVIAIDDRRGTRDWAALGVQDVLPDFFDQKSLLDALAVHARRIGRADTRPDDPGPDRAVSWQGRLAAVCGPGGTGASTVAIALAQGLAGDPGLASSVLLADLARNGEQAMLHDARDVAPGIQELVELHRASQPTTQEARALTFFVDGRGYALLLGLRRASAWSALRRRAFEASVDSLLRGWRVVVCDIDADLEGEAEGGSMDVEERNVMARTAVARADVVFAVGTPGMKGLHALVRVIDDLESAGVEPGRIVPVFNRAPRGHRAHTELAAALAALAGRRGRADLAPALFLPDKRVDEALRDGVALPSALSAPLAGAWRALLDRSGPPAPAGTGLGQPQRVVPGAIGSWGPIDGPGPAT